MKKTLSLFPTHTGVGIAQNESNRREKVTLAGSIAADDNIGLRGEGFHNGLVLVAAIRVSGGHGALECWRMTRTYLLKPWMMICLMNMMGESSADARHAVWGLDGCAVGDEVDDGERDASRTRD